MYEFNNKEQINEWIKRSPSIKDQQPVVFSPNNRLISFKSFEDVKVWQIYHTDDILYPLSFANSIMIPKDTNDYHFSLVTNDPKWFKPNITQGRFYKGDYSSEIYIDDDNDVVWITASSD